MPKRKRKTIRKTRRRRNPLTRKEVSNILRDARRVPLKRVTVQQIQRERETYYQGVSDGMMHTARSYQETPSLERQWRAGTRRRRRNPLTLAEQTAIYDRVGHLRQLAQNNRRAGDTTAARFYEGRAEGQVDVAYRYAAKRRNPMTKSELDYIVRARRMATKDRNDARKEKDLPYEMYSQGQLNAFTEVYDRFGGPRAGARRRNLTHHMRSNPELMILNPIDEADEKQAAMERYAEFHGTKPQQIIRRVVDDGKPGMTRRYFVVLGNAPDVTYRAPGHSKKAGSPFLHKFKNEPKLVTDASGRDLFYMDGTFKVSDWIRG